jgi:hypothetical protein
MHPTPRRARRPSKNNHPLTPARLCSAPRAMQEVRRIPRGLQHEHMRHDRIQSRANGATCSAAGTCGTSGPASVASSPECFPGKGRRNPARCSFDPCKRTATLARNDVLRQVRVHLACAHVLANMMTRERPGACPASTSSCQTAFSFGSASALRLPGVYIAKFRSEVCGDAVYPWRDKRVSGSCASRCADSAAGIVI